MPDSPSSRSPRSSGNRGGGPSRGSGGSKGRGGPRRDGDSRGSGGSKGRGGPRRDGDSRGSGGSKGRGGPRRDGDSRSSGGSKGRGGPRRDGDSRGSGGSKRPEGRSGRPAWAEEREEHKPPEAGPKNWGGLARRGAARIDEEAEEGEGRPEFTEEEQRKFQARVAKRDAAARRRDDLRAEAREAVDRSDWTPPEEQRKLAAKRAPLHRPPRKSDPAVELVELLGERRAKRALRQLAEAAEHLDEDRFRDAELELKDLMTHRPDIAEVREVYGLAYYGQGKWKKAIEQLEAFRELAQSTEQNPVLADCYRALERWADVDELWNEVREASPSSAVVTEARIVAAGALADRGELSSAIRLLEQKWKRPKRPLDHHVRRAYALADLLERSGETPRSKELFAWIARTTPGFVDAEARSR